MATFYIELVDAAGDRHWSDVITTDGGPGDALEDAAAFCDYASDGMVFRAYPIDLGKPVRILTYDSEVIY